MQLSGLPSRFCPAGRLAPRLSALAACAFLSALPALAAQRFSTTVDVPSPPAWTSPDTEVCTNVQCSFDRDFAKAFHFSLECAGTASNNVQIAFGRDADGDGALAPHEVALTVGWDVGEWFVRGPVDGLRLADAPADPGPSRTLDWSLRFDARGRPRGLLASDGAGALFQAVSANPPGWLFDRSWNMVRVTARGVDAEVGDVSVAVVDNGMIIRFR